MPHIPGTFDELEKAVEQGTQSITSSVKKSVSQTAQATAQQVKPGPSDFVKQLYGVKDDQPQDDQPKQHDPVSNAQKYGTLADQISPLTPRSEEEIKASAGPVMNQFRMLPQQDGKTSSLGEQLTGQAESSDDFMKIKIDPSKQMTEDERQRLTDEQKEKRELLRQHDRSYVKGPLDPIGTLEEQIAKVRQQKDQEEQQKEKEEQEEKDEKIRQEKEQQSRQLQPPRGKVRGAPNMAVDHEKKKTESFRGVSG